MTHDKFLSLSVSNNFDDEPQEDPFSGIDRTGFRKSRVTVDDKGHSTRITFSIQPQSAAVIRELVNEYGDEYKAEGDFIRHAVREHIRRLSKHKKLKNSLMIKSSISQVESILEILAAQEELMSFEQTIQRSQEVINRLVMSGAVAEAARTIAQVRQKIKDMEHSHWRDKYLQDFNRAFEGIEKQMTGVSLSMVKSIS
jgi:Arc/MetJ-type ribon-helix-helix transcriptional regulator